MDDLFNSVLAEYTQRSEAEEHIWETEDSATLFQRRDEFLLHIGEHPARFLHALAVANEAKMLVEIGTSYGYSTLFLADAARKTGGKLITFEISAEKQNYAKEKLEKANLAEYVDWQLGDAVSLLKELKNSVDFVLIDIWKDLYIPCFELLYPKLNPGAIIAADNMLEPKMHREDAEKYRAAIKKKRDLQTLLLPIGSGIELSCLIPQQLPQ
ncbi:MAG: methyltransferase [SAR86 cluster bacterium]|uniref:Methyltransferase n=1 Tax=SAR86 cluster bacterium TaxID=2030880 RepID=A0A2A5C7M1_9GAMM|nr:class I SAM-dependent methyltransferase [bacterium AH-315-I11]PCJ39807.1 MAG: methyltransferase [SAR86 cluster bacterium]